MTDLAEIQNALQHADLDGWLLFDFRGMNPIAAQVAGLPPEGVFSRRWAYWIPAHGQAARLVHRIEAGPFAGSKEPVHTYVTWQELTRGIQDLLGPARRIAMEYSPGGAIPYVARVDAGTMELIRSLGVEVVSSADLVQWVQARWTPAQLAQHREAARLLNQIKDECFAWLAAELRAGRSPGEVDGQQFVMHRFAETGLVTDHPPILGINAHSGDPHYAPATARQHFLKAGDFVLLDLWAKLDQPGAVFADITWVAFAGAEAPAAHRQIFDIVAEARDAAVQFIQKRFRAGQRVQGFEVDDAARAVIERAGYGAAFFHRTGHSIDTSGHGNGVNMDNLETHDERTLIPGVGFSIEPGIYLAEFGVRSEINMIVGDGFAEVTTQPVQQAIVPLLPA
jgi:Xaa-Pro aminopeptidase